MTTWRGWPCFAVWLLLLFYTGAGYALFAGTELNLSCNGSSYVKSTTGPIVSSIVPVQACAYRAYDCYEMNFTGGPCDYIQVAVLNSGYVYFEGVGTVPISATLPVPSVIGPILYAVGLVGCLIVTTVALL